MPMYRLTDDNDLEVHAVRRISHQVANSLTEARGDGLVWKQGLDPSHQKPVRSLHQIVRSLDTEGFDEHAMNVVNRFMHHRVNHIKRSQDHYEKARKLFAEFMSQHTVEDRKVVGRFMSAQCGRSFEAGLRLGMTGHYAEHALSEDTGNPDGESLDNTVST